MTEIKPEWADDLRKVHEQLPVNSSFKEELRRRLIAEGDRRRPDGQAGKQLRRELTNRRRNLRMWGSAAVIAAVAAVVLLLNLLVNPAVSRVNAAELRLQLQFNSDKSLGTEPSVASAIDHDRTYYAIPEQGIYRQSGLSYTRLASGDIKTMALSPSGKQLAYVIGHEIFLLDLTTLKSRTVAAAPHKSILIASLAWSADESRLAYVREDPATDLVMEAELGSGKQRQLAKGTSPSYTKDGGQLLYEKHGSIYILQLDQGSEQLWREGRSPLVSPDGRYVLYVRSSGELNMEDVWIADLDGQTEQQVTHNEAVDGWVNGELKEGALQPYFRVGNMVWSRDSEEIGVYLLKESNKPSRDLVRYKLSAQELAPEEVVGKSIEALIYRDERYAHSFFSYDPGYLKGTSPRQVGYTIVDKTEDDQGRWTVTANIDYAYQDPYYSVHTLKFTLTRHEQGYMIDGMQEVDSTTITTWEQGNEIVTTVDDQRGELLFKLAEVPQDKGWTNNAFGHLVYRQTDNRKQVWFLVKQTETKGDKVRLRVMQYDWDSKEFHALGSIDGESQSVLMLVDESGKWAAVKVERKNAEYDIAIFSLQASDTKVKPQMLSNLLQGSAYSDINLRLWKDGKLNFFVEWEGRDVFMEYEIK